MRAAPVTFGIDQRAIILYVVHFASPEGDIAGSTAYIDTFRVCVVLRIMGMADMQVFKLHIVDTVKLYQSIPPPFDIQSGTVYPGCLAGITFNVIILPGFPNV